MERPFPLNNTSNVLKLQAESLPNKQALQQLNSHYMQEFLAICYNRMYKARTNSIGNGIK